MKKKKKKEEKKEEEEKKTKKKRRRRFTAVFTTVGHLQTQGCWDVTHCH